MAPISLNCSDKENMHSDLTKKSKPDQRNILTDVTNKTIGKKAQLKRKSKVKKTVKTIHQTVLPSGVEDIDKDDHHDPQLCSEYLPQIFTYLRQKEEASPIQRSFLQDCSINGSMRSILMDWLVEVQIMFQLLPETLYLAQFILDDFLQKGGSKISKEKLQLVGATCMFTASKCEETNFPSVSDYVYIADHAFTAKNVISMERHILRTINFNLGRPLPLNFLRRFSKAGRLTEVQHNMAKYILETSILTYELSHHLPSKMAASSLLLSILLLNPSSNPQSSWTPTLQHYSSYKIQKLLPVVQDLAAVMKGVKHEKLQAVYNKYKSSSFLSVSQLNVLDDVRLDQLSLIEN